MSDRYFNRFNFNANFESDCGIPNEGAEHAPPPQPEQWPELPTLGPMTLDQAKPFFTKWLELPDTDVIDFMFGVVFANRLEGDPVWGGIIGPSGDGKTELLRTMEGHGDVFFLSNLTKNTLISGYITESDGLAPDPSLIPKLDGLVLIIKELTPILTGDSTTRGEILGQLRDAYDGSSTKAFGTGEVKSYNSKFGLLFGVTPIIETHLAFASALGERFLYWRNKESDTLAKISAALRNSGVTNRMRDELITVAHRVLDQDIEWTPECADDVLPKLAAVADLMARARSSVAREGRSEDVLVAPSPEVGTRVVGQLIRLGHGIAAANAQREWGENLLPILYHVVKSGIPSARLPILEALWRLDGWAFTRTIGDEIRMPTSGVKRHAEDLWSLGLVIRQGSGQHEWRLSDLAIERLKVSGLFNL